MQERSASLDGQPRPHLTVVIPTFNRASALIATVSSVFASDLAPDVRLEVIVVDDGSSEPASRVLDGSVPPPDGSLRVVRQDNQGVGAARNRGRREAAGDIIVFVDDDMLLLPSTLPDHLAAHRHRPGSVIFGRSPYVAQPEMNPFVSWVKEREAASRPVAGEDDLRPARIIASGHLSIERAGPVGQWPEVYAHDMRTPVAEEYELSHRLGAHRIPVFRAPHIVAWHNRTIDVDSFLPQQLGHGRGCAEVARLHPECLDIEELRGIIEHHRRRSVRRMLWVLLGAPRGRSLLRRAARAGERGRFGPLAPLVFKLAAGAWFSAGVRAPAGIR